MKTDSDAFALALLFDYYGQTLTEKQRLCFDLYYNQDLSLAEIAENEGISRQGVHDSLARAELSLRAMEKKLGFVARERRLTQISNEILSLTAPLQQASDPAVRAAADAIAAAAHRIKE